MERREFLKLAGAGVASSSLLSAFAPASAFAGKGGGIAMPDIHLFSKCLHFLDYEDLAAASVELGFDGLDLTVRPSGHVEPENFERDLPAAIEAINDAGISCEMMVTKITDTKDRRNFDLLKLAHSLGVKSYRTGGLKYKAGVPAMESLEQYTLQLAKLAEWNREIGITGMYQIHSGEWSFGASIWDIYLATKDLNPGELGIQFDVRHATTEGGRNWPDSFRLVQPQIRTLAIKDFKWAVVDDKWKLVNTPIGDGMVDLKRHFRMLKDTGTLHPISLHVEHDLGGAEKGKRNPTMPKEDILARIKYDLDMVKKIWAMPELTNFTLGHRTSRLGVTILPPGPYASGRRGDREPVGRLVWTKTHPSVHGCIHSVSWREYGHPQAAAGREFGQSAEPRDEPQIGHGRFNSTERNR